MTAIQLHSRLGSSVDHQLTLEFVDLFSTVSYICAVLLVQFKRQESSRDSMMGLHRVTLRPQINMK